MSDRVRHTDYFHAGFDLDSAVALSAALSAGVGSDKSTASLPQGTSLHAVLVELNAMITEAESRRTGYLYASSLFFKTIVAKARFTFTGTSMPAANPRWRLDELDWGYWGYPWGIAYGDGKWVVVFDGGGIAATTDILNGPWTVTELWQYDGHYGIAYGGGLWVAVGENGVILTATDPFGTWTARSSGTTQFLWRVAEGGGKWVAVGGSGGSSAMTTSTNGTTWVNRSSPLNGSNGLSGIAYADGVWVTCGGDGGIGGISTATDPAGTWTQRWTLPNSHELTHLAYADGLWVACGYRYLSPVGTFLVTSTDPASSSWTQRNLENSLWPLAIHGAEGVWLFTAENTSNVYVATDPRTDSFTAHSNGGFSLVVRAIEHAGTVWALVGDLNNFPYRVLSVSAPPIRLLADAVIEEAP